MLGPKKQCFHNLESSQLLWGSAEFLERYFVEATDFFFS